MKSLLLVIDLQNSFINENTEFLKKKIQDLISEKRFDEVVFTRFINYENGPWVTKLNYYGCITEEDRAIAVNTGDNRVIDKTTYTSLNNELVNYIKENNISDIYICGIDSECCVMQTAVNMFESGYNVYVLKDHCACTHGEEKNKAALDIIARNIGKNFVI